MNCVIHSSSSIVSRIIKGKQPLYTKLSENMVVYSISDVEGLQKVFERFEIFFKEYI